MKAATGLFVLLTVLLVGCGPAAPGEKGTEIISAAQALKLAADGAVFVDAQRVRDYDKGHVAGAVNVWRVDIVVHEPFPNMLPPASQINEVMSSRGIGNETLVVAYDSNKNMDAARLWWTLKVYGHDEVKVVSGGLEALKQAGAEITEVKPIVTPASFKAGEARSEMIATRADVKGQVDYPAADVVIIDTRSLEETDAGTVPGSVCLDYSDNNFKDGTYRPVQHIRIQYLEQGVDYDKTAIMFCKTSIRAAQTYLALYNAGYRDLKVYDGAWLEWSGNPANPIQMPDSSVAQMSSSDAS